MKQSVKAISIAALVALSACQSSVTEDSAQGAETASGAATATTGTTESTLPATSGSGASGPVLAVEENTVRYFETNVGDRVLFDTDSAFLDANDQAILTFQADWLLRYPEREARIEGHADERGTREYNLALGARRAQAVHDYLVSLGVDSGRLEVVSFGKERPISVCSDEICWSQNRRGTTVVVPIAGL